MYVARIHLTYAYVHIYIYIYIYTRIYSVAQFKRETKCEGGTMEAVSYLYMAEFDLSKAVTQYKGDVKWESQNDVMSKRKSRIL